MGWYSPPPIGRQRGECCEFAARWGQIASIREQRTGHSPVAYSFHQPPLCFRIPPPAQSRAACPAQGSGSRCGEMASGLASKAMSRSGVPDALAICGGEQAGRYLAEDDGGFLVAEVRGQRTGITRQIYVMVGSHFLRRRVGKLDDSSSSRLWGNRLGGHCGTRRQLDGCGHYTRQYRAEGCSPDPLQLRSAAVRTDCRMRP